MAAKATMGKCAVCDKPVLKQDNRVQLHLAAGEAPFHYRCFFVVANLQNGQLAVERAAWQAERRVH